MTKFKATYILAIITFLLVSCRQVKNVPDGKYLVKSNKIHVKGEALETAELLEIVKQPANFKTLNIKLKLHAYNWVDSASVSDKRIRKNVRLKARNSHKLIKQNRINEARIQKAKKKGSEYYTKKIVPLKDTLNPRLFVREWMKYKYGEPPVIFDSSAMNKTVEQHANYLKKKGFYYGTNGAEVIFKRRKKAFVHYYLETGKQLFIDSVNYQADNPPIIGKYKDYLAAKKIESLKGLPFDRDILDNHRSVVAKAFRDDLYYGFSASNISYEIDTNDLVNNGVVVTLKIANRVMYHPDHKDSIITLKHQETFIRDVYFHISDTSLFKGNFKDSLATLGLNLFNGQFLTTIDTLEYKEIIKKKTKELDVNRMATFLFNGDLFIDPGVIESQNYLEEAEKYKEYYIDRTYTRLLQLGVFAAIKPQIVEIIGTNKIDVHYFLVPGEKESFGFEPRFTSSNGYFGLTSSVFYTNNNLFGGAQKLRVALNGGFESQPPVFDPTLSDEEQGKLSRTLNTLEFGPSLVFDVPGLFPTKVTMVNKRLRPRTVVSVAYNYQKRTEFFRQTFQANYMWKTFGVNKTQVFQFGFPLLSVVKYVNITKAPAFEAKLLAQNDPFLRNSYSDQLIWQDWKFIFEYNSVGKDVSRMKNKKPFMQVYYNGSFDLAGSFLGLFQSYQNKDTLGRYEIFGVAYSQFIRLDNDVILSKVLNKKTSAHLRFLAGGGVPTGNKGTSLPFDYSFFGGGSNDNRGWRARTLGPGAYKYLLDTNRTLTQIADIRISSSAEYRFSIGPNLKAAVFMDAGNVWTAKEDVNRPGSQFTKNWFKEIAYSAGFGLRLDLDFFILRLDLGIPLNNVSTPENSRWIWQPRDALLDELINFYGQTTYDRLKKEGKMPGAFQPRLHFGIGYPF